MQKKSEKFKAFLESLETQENKKLIGCIAEGFQAINEAATAPGKSIRTTYEVWNEEALEAGETDDKGWEDEEGQSMEPDQYDIEEGKSAVDLAVEFLNQRGPMEPSNSDGGNGTWYTGPIDRDIRTGDEKILAYHLSGFDPDEEDEIFDRVEK